MAANLDAGYALALPWLRGVGFYAPHTVEDFAPGQLDHAYLGENWYTAPDPEAIFNDVWDKLAVNGVVAVSAATATYSRQQFGQFILKKTGWRCLDDVEKIPAKPSHWYAALLKLPVELADKTVYEPLEQQPRDILVVRTGGFGDGLLASYAASRLKKADPERHITYLVSENAGKMLQYNPHIDRLLVFERHRYGDDSFGLMVACFAPRFKQLVFLNETVEGVLLSGSKNGWFHWPKEARHAIANHNYEEVTSRVTGLTFEPGHVSFHPTADERAQALLPPGVNVAWALSGSTEHKTWPYLGIALSRMLLLFPGVTFHLLGGGSRDKKLIVQVLKQVEQIAGIMALRRVKHDLDQDVRVSYALAQKADILVAAETGVLWACAYGPNTKIVLLSHSSQENLTKHWRNTVALEPQGCEQFPCHKLHFGGDECPVNAEGVSVCAAAISTDVVVKAVTDALRPMSKLADGVYVEPESPMDVAAD